MKGCLLKIRTLNPKTFVIEEVSRPQENLAHTDVFVSGSLCSITGIIRRKSWKYCNSCGADVRVLLQEFEKHQHLIMSAGIHRHFCCHVAISFESATGINWKLALTLFKSLLLLLPLAGFGLYENSNN